MRIKFRAAGIVAAATALAIAVPAAAHPGKADHPSNTNPPSQSHRCAPHNVAYVVSGVVTDSSMAQNDDGTWSGTLTYTVKHHNHAAKGDPGSATFTNAKLKVKFDDGTTAFAPGERVRLIGKLATVRKGCDVSGSSPVFRMVVVHPAPTS